MFRTNSNIHDGAFFTLVKPHFKNVLNSIELPFSFGFLRPCDTDTYFRNILCSIIFPKYYSCVSLIFKLFQDIAQSKY